MQPENTKVNRSWIFFLVSSVFTGALSLIYFVLLGMFYVAKEHMVLTNIVVWTATGLLAYVSFYLLDLLVYGIFKKAKWLGPFANGWAISAAYLSVLIVCLAQSKNFDDYAFVSTYVFLSGVPALTQMVLGWSSKKKLKRKSSKADKKDIS